MLMSNDKAAREDNYILGNVAARGLDSSSGFDSSSGLDSPSGLDSTMAEWETILFDSKI